MSAVPVVKAALVARIGSLFPDAQVSYGAPLKASREEIVAVMGARTTEAPDSLVPSMREAIEVDIVFSVWAGRGSQQRVTERAYEMFSAWRSHVADDPSLGGACQAADVAIAHNLDEAMTDAGPVAEVATTVRLFAAYTP